MTAPSFTMKFIRADEHLKALDDAVVDFLATRPYEVVTEQVGRQISGRAVYRHEPPDRLLMLIGDAVHNLRSALDHLAWSLAGTSASRRTEFPVFVSRTKFSKRGKKKMRGISASAQTIIESLQPYNRPHGLPEEREPLWLLHNLDIKDKHHTLNLIGLGLFGSVLLSTSEAHPAYGLTGVTGYLPLIDGAEVFRFSGPIDQSQLQDHSRYTFDVAFDPRGPAGGVGLREGLREVRESVAAAIKLLEPHVL
jgi:hypothetical protein